MSRKILVMAIVLLLATLLVSPLIGSVAACKGQNEENEKEECRKSDLAHDGWTLVNNGRAVKAYPELREYVWQKERKLSTQRTLRQDRFAQTSQKRHYTERSHVHLRLPPCGEWANRCISNPPGDNWTKYENYSQAIYWANRGFDVYAIDYRSHFIPTSLNASQVSFMADWGWDVWISDIKEAAEKVKEVSGSKKFFIAGECTGGDSSPKLRNEIRERRSERHNIARRIHDSASRLSDCWDARNRN